MGPSGSGKTSSLEEADPRSGFIIQVLRKPLPFRGAKKKWTEASEQNKKGNVYVTDDPTTIIEGLKRIDAGRPEVKNIFIDDSQYIMGNEFMRSALEKGYDKFSRIGADFWNIVQAASKLRPDLIVFFLHHTEVTDQGDVKAKTIGNMLDSKITLEGMFTVVLRAAIVEEKYVFLTKSGGRDTVKSPKGMFKSPTIANDINLVIEAMRSY